MALPRFFVDAPVTAGGNVTLDEQDRVTRRESCAFARGNRSPS
jgi:hypothetical protein